MRRSLALAAVATMLLGGCGEDEREGGSSARLSKAEFAERGAQICREGAKEAVEEVERELAKPKHRGLDETERQFLAFRTGTDTVRRTLDRLGDLRAPEEIEPRVTSMRRGIEETFDVLRKLERAAREKDEAEEARLARRMQELARSTRGDARAAGLDACLPENA